MNKLENISLDLIELEENSEIETHRSEEDHILINKAIWKLRKYNKGAIRIGRYLEDLEMWLKKETVNKSDIIRLLK